MITYAKGSLFNIDADIVVNTVNCVGAMGAGVALAFKKRYPDMFKTYRKECRQRKYKPGWPMVYDKEDKIIINFPTKDHWQNPAEYIYIETGLYWLHGYLKNKPHVTIAIPPLGCGHGGLSWSKVKPMIEERLSDLEANIIVFEPKK